MTIARRKRVNLCPTEDMEQIKLVAWMMKENIPHAASANAGKRSWQTGKKLKACGLAVGFPDLFIPIAIPPYHGLFIELKREEGGILSDSQIFWLELLRKNGYFADVARGFDIAKKMIMDYLGQKNV